MNILNIIKDWIYPAYNLRNLLFHRYDLVKLPKSKFKPYCYADVVERLEYANFELIKYFVEKEQPEKHVEWKGEFGAKYEGNIKELNGKWIIDIIKEIYNFYTVELPILKSDYNYILHLWIEYTFDKRYNFTINKISKEVYFADLKLDWKIVDKYIDDRNKIYDEKYLNNKIDELELNIHNKIQYYLHLCIDVRPYLWVI